MNLEITKLTSKNYFEVVKKVALLVKRGKIIIVPYDTVYGFIGNYKSQKVIRKIFKLKKRPITKTIGLALSDFKVLKKISILDKKSEEFIKKRTPGKYSFIVKRNPKFNLSSLCKKDNTIAVRIPKSKFVLDIIDKSGGIVVQTSANISEKPNCFSIEELKKQYSFEDLEKIDLIIDGGRIRNRGASNIFDLTKGKYRLKKR